MVDPSDLLFELERSTPYLAGPARFILAPRSTVCRKRQYSPTSVTNMNVTTLLVLYVTKEVVDNQEGHGGTINRTRKGIGL